MGQYIKHMRPHDENWAKSKRINKRDNRRIHKTGRNKNNNRQRNLTFQMFSVIIKELPETFTKECFRPKVAWTGESGAGKNKPTQASIVIEKLKDIMKRYQQDDFNELFRLTQDNESVKNNLRQTFKSRDYTNIYTKAKHEIDLENCMSDETYYTWFMKYNPAMDTTKFKAKWKQWTYS
ncbi:hypothetical protein ACF0H5_003496 [Mactra antiquata]